MGLFTRSKTPSVHFRMATYVLSIPILMFYGQSALQSNSFSYQHSLRQRRSTLHAPHFDHGCFLPDTLPRRAVKHRCPAPLLTVFSCKVLAIVGSVSDSPGIPNIFIVSLSDSANNAGPKSGFEVHVGYFGLCVSLSQHLTCVASIGANVEHVTASIVDNSNTTSSSILTDTASKALIHTALTIQSKTIYWVLIAAGLTFLLDLLVLLLLQLHQKKAQPKPNAPRQKLILKRLLLIGAWTSIALAFAAALSTTQTAANLRNTAASGTNTMHNGPQPFIPNSLVIEPGVVLQTLQWLAFSFSFFFCRGVSSMFMSADGGRPHDGGSASAGVKQLSSNGW